MIREANKEDLKGLLHLYLYLHETEIPECSQHLIDTWDSILEDKNHHIILNEIDGVIVSSCVCVIIPNLTRGIAEVNNCYKMMLLTGSKEQSTLEFYSRAGYNSADKTAFIQWLE